MSAAEIIQGPQNVTVHEGESAMFPCLYTGTNEFPLWYINSASYAILGTSLGLPERHRYFNQTITVRDVQPLDNGNTYRCSFLFDEITKFLTIISILFKRRIDSDNQIYLTLVANYVGIINVCR